MTEKYYCTVAIESHAPEGTKGNNSLSPLPIRVRLIIRDNKLVYYEIKCPACKENHLIPNTDKVKWIFNGSYHLPTFHPSVKHWANIPGKPWCCHYNITDGKIIFHNDCTHDMKNQTVDLPEVE